MGDEFAAGALQDAVRNFGRRTKDRLAHAAGKASDNEHVWHVGGRGRRAARDGMALASKCRARLITMNVFAPARSAMRRIGDPSCSEPAR